MTYTHRRTALAGSAAVALLLTACGNPTGIGGGDEEGGATEFPDRVDLVVPYSEGGGTDTWARFLAPHLEETVEGNPSFVVENRPGGESITGSNQFTQDGSTDGSELLVTSGTTYFQALLGRDEVQFDFSVMEPLVLNGTGGVIYVSSSTGIESVEDLGSSEEDLVYGGISATGLDLSLLQAMDVLDVDIEATFGFEGRGPARLALERGEVNLDYQTTSAYLTQVEPMVESGEVVPLMSFGVIEDGEIVRDPNVPDLPTVEEAYEMIHGEAPSGEAYDAYRAFLIPGFVYQKGIWANEGTSEELIQVMWDAAATLSEDEEFNEAAGDVLGGYPLYPGEIAADDLREAFEIEPEVQQYTLDMLEEEYDTTL